jgi:phosphatidate cytidylyltransferase
MHYKVAEDKMLKRIISALVGAPLIALFLIVEGNYLYLFAGILSLVGMYEYYRAIKATGVKTIDFIGYVFCIAFYILQLAYPKVEIFSKLAAIMLILLFTYEIFTHRSSVNGIVHTLFGFIYVSFLLAHIIFINNLENGAVLIWLPFLTAWFTDTAAYFTGITIGKHKLSPTISPKKTIEGAVGGIVGSILLTTIFGIIIRNYNSSIAIHNFILIGLLCGIFSQLGDLAASYIKRHTKLKDFGNLIPGHGGILDRFDSILFTTPVVYYYFLLVQNF